MTKLEKTMAALRADTERPKTAEVEVRDLNEDLNKGESKSEPSEWDTAMDLPDEQPTVRDLATALYSQKQGKTCRNCLRREQGNCPSKAPRPKQCFSFQLNTRQMQTYGTQARNVIKAWRDAIALHAQRRTFAKMREMEKLYGQQ